MNKPSDPATFVAPYRINMAIDIDDRIDDGRRIRAENWCLHNTSRGWFRRIPKCLGSIEFHFEDQNEATMFWLAN